MSSNDYELGNLEFQLNSPSSPVKYWHNFLHLKLCLREVKCLLRTTCVINGRVMIHAQVFAISSTPNCLSLHHAAFYTAPSTCCMDCGRVTFSVCNFWPCHSIELPVFCDYESNIWLPRKSWEEKYFWPIFLCIYNI